MIANVMGENNHIQEEGMLAIKPSVKRLELATITITENI